jgi:hypothetical protein
MTRNRLLAVNVATVMQDPKVVVRAIEAKMQQRLAACIRHVHRQMTNISVIFHYNRNKIGNRMHFSYH